MAGWGKFKTGAVFLCSFAGGCRQALWITGFRPTAVSVFARKGDLLFSREKSRQKPVLLPEGSGKPYGLPVPAPAGGVLSLAPEKVPKERVQGEDPLDTPAQLDCVRFFPASWTRGCAASTDALRASASVCFGYRTPPGRLEWQGASACAPLEVQTRRLEHQDQAPVGVAKVRQDKSAKGRRPPCVAGSVSRCAPVNRDWHRFCAPVKWGFLGGKPCVRGTPSVPS